MMRNSNTNDIQELKKLWKDCFGDEDSYINNFFASMYNGEHVLLAEKDGMLMGASFFLPAKLYQNGIWQDIRYVYALATDRHYRGRGVARTLLHYANEWYGAPLVAEPADKELADGFYEPLSFARSFYLSEYHMKMPQYGLRAAEKMPDILPADAETYCRIRDKKLLQEGYAAWPPAHAAFAIAEHQRNGGGALQVCSEAEENIILYYQDKETVVVTETTLPPEETTDALLSILPQGITQLCIRCAMNSRKGTEKLMGMSYGLTVKNGYLNLTLD